MVIALLLPTLQILDMGRISSTHLVITQMGIIRGYEIFQAPFIYLFLSVQLQFVTCFNFFCWTRTVINRTISEELVKDLEGCREAAVR